MDDLSHIMGVLEMTEAALERDTIGENPCDMGLEDLVSQYHDKLASIESLKTEAAFLWDAIQEKRLECAE